VTSHVRDGIYGARRMDLRSTAHQRRYQLLPWAAPVLQRRCALLLPRPSLSWRTGVGLAQQPYWQHWAAAHNVAHETYRDRALSWLELLLRDAEVRLRLPQEVLATVLTDGRYKSQFEVDASRGALNRGQRQMLEWMTLGIPPGARDRDRPVYGYLSGSLEGGLLQQYGDVVLRLRPDVRWRSTFCMGDSLDSVLSQPRPVLGPAPVGRPRLISADPRFDLLSAGDPWQAVSPPHHYVEAQIHGAVTTREMAEAVFTHGDRPSSEVQELLSSRGITWRTVEGEGP
jgi:Protein of unknown function (DUF3626)